MNSCFSCNLSALISQYQRLHIRALCNFFGQVDHRPPKSECARTPMDIVVKNEEIKLSQYADDVTLISDGSMESLKACIQTLDNFYEASCLILNDK